MSGYKVLEQDGAGGGIVSNMDLRELDRYSLERDKIKRIRAMWDRIDALEARVAELERKA